MTYTHPLKDLVQNRPLLSSLADKFGTPLYIYSGNRLRQNVGRLNNALEKACDAFHICYAVKANSNPHLIKTMRDSLPSLGADCSSPGELYAADQAGIPATDCIYTGNYESMEDLRAALSSGAHVNLDDISSFRRLQKLSVPDNISFRLNPGFGKGTFSQIITAGENAKFGVPKHNIVQAYKLAQDAGVTGFGLQCMTGSGNLDTEYFVSLLNAILETAQEIETQLELHFNFISMGGGFGIPYEENDSPLDILTLFRRLGEIFYQRYDRSDSHTPELWIEPGKYLVGDSAILLTRITGIKDSYRTFIGTDAGMETLMRPALYGAYHKIHKVGAVDDPVTQTVDITGRICENTDRLATDRPFPAVHEGDLLAVMDVGAYGYSMAHQFNTRPRPAEILLENDNPRLIRRSETIEDIFETTRLNSHA